MPKRILLSLDPHKVISDRANHEAFKQKLIELLNGLGYDVGDVELVPGSAYDFIARFTSWTDVVLIAHRSRSHTSIDFDVGGVQVPVGCSLCSLRIILVQFPHVDYSDFTLPTTNIEVEHWQVQHDDDFFAQTQLKLAISAPSQVAA